MMKNNIKPYYQAIRNLPRMMLMLMLVWLPLCLSAQQQEADQSDGRSSYDWSDDQEDDQSDDQSNVQNYVQGYDQDYDLLYQQHDSVFQKTLPTRIQVPELRQISRETLAQLYADEDMDYHLASPEDNLWVLFRKWLFVQLLNLFGTPGAVDALELIFYFLMLAGLVYTVLRLLNVDLQGLFMPDTRRKAVLQQEEDAYENIHEIDFMTAIEEALKAGEYNKAVRLLYLSALKELSEQEQIHWQAGKTNYQYQQELKNMQLQAPFRELGYFFEWAWYGNFSLSEKHYLEARTIYQSLAQQLQHKV